MKPLPNQVLHNKTNEQIQNNTHNHCVKMKILTKVCLKKSHVISHNLIKRRMNVFKE